MADYYATTPQKPFHISIGALIVDENNKILAHHYEKLGRIEDIYILMRESIEANETVEQALHRGLREEFGATGEIEMYLGSIVANDKWFGEVNKETEVEKTTIYFLVRLMGIDDSLRLKDKNETSSEILRLEPDDLIQKMQSQSEKWNVQDINEAKIVETAKKYL